MFNPPHPGETLREDILPALGLSIAQAARELGVSRTNLSRVIRGEAGITIDLALKLETWLKGPTAESWLQGQLAYDLWQARQKQITRKPPRYKLADLLAQMPNGELPILEDWDGITPIGREIF